MPDRAVEPGRSVEADRPVFLLSPRQRQALELAARGWTDIEAARQMDLSPRTVRGHLQAVRLQLRALNTTHAVAIALTHNLIRFGTTSTAEKVTRRARG
jgi:DNA-binding CsgD family transcriptional regulator